ncbi:hypothetical protein V1509DRAFT_571318 [Lipomyces kononenkoae]
MDRRTWTVTLFIILGTLLLTVVVFLWCPPSALPQLSSDVDFNQDLEMRNFKKTSAAFERYTKQKNAGRLPGHVTSKPNADASEAITTSRRETRRALARQRRQRKDTIAQPVDFGLRQDIFQVPLGANRHREGERLDLPMNNKVADDDDVNHEAVNVHIVCSNAVQFDLVLALAGSIMLPPSLQKSEILQNEDIEVAIRQTARTRVNLTIIDATDAAVTTESRHDNAEFDMFRILMLKEAKLLPIQVVKTTTIPGNTPDVLFLASCLDDVVSLHNGIQRALISDTKVQCVIRHPSVWDSSRHKEEMSMIATLAGPYISTGTWSFVVSSKDDLNHVHTAFPNILGVSTITADKISIFNPVFPRTTVRTISVEPGEAATAIGADFIRPLNFRRTLYEHITNRYIETAPNIAMQLLDFIGGSGRMGRYVIPDSIPHGRFSASHNVPLHTYFERVARSKLIVPFPIPEENRELAMRMSDMVATTALSVGRPLFLRKSTYANFFESRIPSDIVVMAEDQDPESSETSLLAALKAYARADTDDIYTAKKVLWQSHISKAEMEHDRVVELNWECMNGIIGPILL